MIAPVISLVRRQFSLIVVFILAAGTPSVYAQTEAGAQKLSTLIENVFGPRGLIVDSDVAVLDGTTHSAHFNSAFQSDFRRVNVAIASQLSGLPLPSPASGFTYRFDADTGTFVRSSQSFGPILTERAETIGRGKTLFGYNVQVYSFDSLDGISLGHVPAVFKHDDYEIGGLRSDVVDTDNSMKLSVSQFTGLVTFGIADRLDASVAIPIVSTHLAVTSIAVIHRFGTTRESATHFFEDPTIPGGIGDRRDFSANGTATGIGDILLHAKGTLMRRGSSAIAVGTEVRFPSGDEEDLLGSGAWGVRPFAVLSFSYKGLSPHLNLGYQWNGRSILAGDVATQVKGDLPDRIMFAGGVDSAISQRLSIALDFLADRVRNSPQLEITPLTVTGPLGSGVFQDLAFLSTSYWISNGSAGLKFALREGLLLNFNVRFNIGGQGLADRATPLVGLEYAF
jgi:Putative MetA-pathway of phenol degradation